MTSKPNLGLSFYILIFFQIGTAYVDYFDTAASNSSEGKIWSRVNPKKQLIENQLHIEKMMLEDGNYVFFAPKAATENLFKSIPCNISTRSAEYFIVSLSWAFQKNSPYLPLINYNLNKGTIQK